MFRIGDMWYSYDWYLVIDNTLYAYAEAGLKLVKVIK